MNPRIKKGNKMRQITIMDCKECFAVPDDSNILDFIHPATGKTWHYGRTLEEVREKHPRAVKMTFADWVEAQTKRQRTPIEWVEITEEKYHDALCALPPAAFTNGAFLLGEPDDHDAGNGKPRFQGFAQRLGKFYASTRPLTRDEFLASIQIALRIVTASPTL